MVFRSKLRLEVRALGHNQSTSAKNKIADRRQHLKGQIDRFNKHAQTILGYDVEGDIMTQFIGQSSQDLDLQLEDEVDVLLDEFEDELDDSAATAEVSPEQLIIMLPSSFTGDQQAKTSLASLALQEQELRVGQANDGLEKLRNALGHKSLLFRTNVRQANSQHTKTRAWGEVDKLNVKI